MPDNEEQFVISLRDEFSEGMNRAEEAARRFAEAMSFADAGTGAGAGAGGDFGSRQTGVAQGATLDLTAQTDAMSESIASLAETVVTAAPQVQDGFAQMAQASDAAQFSFLAAGRGIGGAMLQSIQAVALGRQQMGAAMRQMAVDSIAALGSQAKVKAVMELAEGFAALAVPGLQGTAALHFRAAATYGLVSGVGAAASGALSGGGSGASRSATPVRTEPAARPVASVSAAEPVAQRAGLSVTVNVDGNVVGDDEFADRIADSIRRRLGDGRNYGV